MLAIVRTTCYDWLRRGHLNPLLEASTEEIDRFEADAPSPEALLLRKGDAAVVRDALDRLPPHNREVIILHELEELRRYYRRLQGHRDVAAVPCRKQLEWSIGVSRRTVWRRPLEAAPHVVLFSPVRSRSTTTTEEKS